MMAHFVKDNLITFILWPTESEKFPELRQSQAHHIFSYGQQEVSDIHIVERQSYHISSSACKYIVQFMISSLISLFHMINSLWVTFNAYFMNGCHLTASFPMANRMWAVAHNLWQAVTSHPFLWPTGSESHCIVCKRHWSHHFLWPTAGGWCFSSAFLAHLNSWMSISESDCYIFSTSSFYIIIIIIDCKISFQLTQSYLMWSFLWLMYITFLGSRWVMLMHQVLTFIQVCVPVCRSDDTLDLLLYASITRINFSPYLEAQTNKATSFQSRYFCSFCYIVLWHDWCCNKPIDCQVLVCKWSSFIFVFMLKLSSNCYHCQPILLDQ